jgi:glycolate oxidase iron-sulfur subunit
MGMLASSAEAHRDSRTIPFRAAEQQQQVRDVAAQSNGAPLSALANGTRAADQPTVVLFRGCVMNALFSHVHEATKRTLGVNGYRVIEASGQVCCGALHEHAGAVAAARSLATANVAALEGKADFIVVNSAGCGALLKDYGRLLGSDAAARLGAKVRDVSELLADKGPRPGAPIGLDVAYDAPCHLQHAQRVHQAPLALLEAVPGLRLRLLPGSDRCCGSAGIYSVLQPAMARAVLDSKIASVASARPRPDLIVTGNPGCLMQIGAGLRAARLPIGVAHPVELLDLSYDEAGYYEARGSRV